LPKREVNAMGANGNFGKLITYAPERPLSCWLRSSDPTINCAANFAEWTWYSSMDLFAGVCLSAIV
jgi:hypothetical protein